MQGWLSSHEAFKLYTKCKSWNIFHHNPHYNVLINSISGYIEGINLLDTF